ncbi:Kelch repeat-containing protein [Leptospira kemamanensis]|nr:kelch repeat-containing protein [Leptospira kemamanensis]
MDVTNQKRKFSILNLAYLIVMATGLIQCGVVSEFMGNPALEKELKDTQTLALLGLIKPGEVQTINNGTPIENPNNNSGTDPNSIAPLTPPPEPLKNIWATLSNLPRNFAHSTSQTIGDKIYIFGSTGIGDNTVYSYNTVTAQWNKLKNMPSARYGATSARIGNKIYVLGGYEYVYQMTYDPPPYCANQLLWHCFQWVDPPPQYGYVANARNSMFIYDTVTDTWTTGAPMLVSSSFHSSVGYNGKIYLFRDGSVDVYDASSNQWNLLLTNSPIRFHYSIQVFDDKFYFLGGYSNVNGYFNNVFEFDPETLTFRQMTNMPTNRTLVVTALVGDKIYVMGGHENEHSLVVEEFSPDTNSWTAKTSLPQGAFLNRGVGGYANNRFYGIGGYSNVVVYYDPANDTTTHLKVLMNFSRYYFASAVYNNKYYVFGGNINGYAINGIESLDLVSNSWSNQGNLPNAKFGHKAAILGNKIYLVGGMRNGSAQAEVEIYDPETGSITPGTPMDTPRTYHSLCVNNGKMYAVGGNNGSTILNSIEEYDPATDKWTYKRTMTSARTETACAFHENKLYVFGGRIGDSNYTASVESYNPASDSWTLHKPMNTQRSLFDVVKLRGRIYAIGGWNSGSMSQVEKYDPTLEQWIPEYPMNSVRYGHSAIAPDPNRIIVVGGHNGSNSLNSAEEFY